VFSEFIHSTLRALPLMLQPSPLTLRFDKTP
jgi:hypothetical protein